MDFITHSLIGVGAARLIVPNRELRPQVSLAALLGALLIDGDSWLYLVDPSWYGKYHRVMTHSLPGLVIHIALAAAIAWFVAKQWSRTRRFGWFVHDRLSPSQHPPLVSFGCFALVAAASAFLHPPMDAITGFGNVQPLWPLSNWDASLRAVTSFDAVIFVTTFCWHLLIRHLDWPRRREALVSAAYLCVITVYVLIRFYFGEPTFI